MKSPGTRASSAGDFDQMLFPMLLCLSDLEIVCTISLCKLSLGLVSAAAIAYFQLLFNLLKVPSLLPQFERS